jgi:hypothetical protein
MNTKKVRVTLTVSDWTNLINFVGGDLDCMDASDPSKQQMLRVCDEIRKRVALSEYLAEHKTP